MSIKIYTAYRTTGPTDIWSLVDRIHTRGRAEAIAAIRRLYEVRLMGVDEASTDYRKSREVWKDDFSARLAMVHTQVLEDYARAQTALSDPYNLNVSLSIHPHEDRLYLIPSCDGCMARVLDFLDSYPLFDLERYSYWTDRERPAGISAQDWEARGAVWATILDRWSMRLVLHIVAYPGFSQIDPFPELMEEGQKNEELHLRVTSLKQIEKGLCPHCGGKLETRDSLFPGAQWTNYYCKCGFSTRAHLKMRVGE